MFVFVHLFVYVCVRAIQQVVSKVWQTDHAAADVENRYVTMVCMDVCLCVCMCVCVLRSFVFVCDVVCI